MAFSTPEKEGCRRILNQLGTSDLLSLYQTVAKTKTTLRGKEEIIDRIIEKSKTATELLNRKKVYRDIIFEYLNKEHIFMYAKSTKQQVIDRSLEHWRTTAISQTVKSNAAEKFQSQSLQLPNTTSDTDFGQLCVQITSLSIDHNQEDSKKLDRAETVTRRDAQIHQNDSAGTSPPSNVHSAASSTKTTPQKGKHAPHPRENAPSRSTFTPSMPTFTNQSYDSHTFTVLSGFTSGAKPKVKPTPKKYPSTAVSVTVSVTTVSEFQQNPRELSQVHATKGPRTKKC